jgi:hypothetical protein
MKQDKTDTSHQFESHCEAGAELFAVKNTQYGNAFQVYGVLGVVCEILGVVARLPQLVLWSPDHGASMKEKLRDIFLDLHNFSVMALIVLEDNNWDGRRSG